MPTEPRTTCSTCGATILSTTATRTGGLCMACKQGIRQNIEAAKVYYRQQRLPDPFRDHWTALVRRVHNMPDGFNYLSPLEQTYYSVSILVGEAYNGGVPQFFSKSSGSIFPEDVPGFGGWGTLCC